MTIINIILIVGYTVSFLGAIVIALRLELGHGWPPRASLAVAIVLAVLGPVSAIPIAAFVLWLLGRYVVHGLRDAWRIARPRKTGGDLPRAEVRRGH